MSWLRDLTIKNKLTVIMMITSLGAVLLACVVFINSSFILHKKEHLQKNIRLANITGSNCQAALMFDIPEDAEKMLSSLSADRSIIFACLYTPDGKVFAEYRKSDKYADITPSEMRDQGYSYEGKYLRLFHTILLNDKAIGSIYLLDDEREIYTALKWDIFTLVLVLLVTLTAAYIIAFRLQKVISKPILSLAETAETVTKTKDYSIRAEKHGKDEVGTLIDSFNLMLSEIQLRESALAESEERFRSLAQTASSAIISANSNGEIVFWNPVAEKMFGFPEDEAIGSPLTMIMPERYRRMHTKGFQRVVGTGKTRITGKTVELYGLKKDGSEFPLELSLSKWSTPEGTFFTAILNDITIRKKGQTERERLLRALASKNEELESIVYTASHDLRSPLVNIDGFSQELAYSCDDAVTLFREVELPHELEKKLENVLTEDIPASLNFIRSSTNKMDMLVKGLLKLSRLGRAVFEIKPLDMNKMFAHIQRTMQHQINESGVELVIEEELPNCMGDTSQIHQVFTNLIDNALKYLDPERKGQVRISGCPEKDKSIYSVQDNGVGIDPGHKEKVFEIFHRLNPEGAIRGEGIGLTIVKRIIDRHGGKIWVDSETGKGTTFHIALPSA